VGLSDRDYRDVQHKTLTLDPPELVRRCLLHVLPKGLMRVRHYGLPANHCPVQRLALIREILAVPPPQREPRSCKCRIFGCNRATPSPKWGPIGSR